MEHEGASVEALNLDVLDHNREDNPQRMKWKFSSQLDVSPGGCKGGPSNGVRIPAVVSVTLRGVLEGTLAQPHNTILASSLEDANIALHDVAERLMDNSKPNHTANGDNCVDCRMHCFWMGPQSNCCA